MAGVSLSLSLSLSLESAFFATTGAFATGFFAVLSSSEESDSLSEEDFGFAFCTTAAGLTTAFAGGLAAALTAGFAGSSLSLSESLSDESFLATTAFAGVFFTATVGFFASSSSESDESSELLSFFADAVTFAGVTALVAGFFSSSLSELSSELESAFFLFTATGVFFGVALATLGFCGGSSLSESESDESLDDDCFSVGNFFDVFSKCAMISSNFGEPFGNVCCKRLECH